MPNTHVDPLNFFTSDFQNQRNLFSQTTEYPDLHLTHSKSTFSCTQPLSPSIRTHICSSLLSYLIFNSKPIGLAFGELNVGCYVHQQLRRQQSIFEKKGVVHTAASHARSLRWEMPPLVNFNIDSTLPAPSSPN